MGNNRTIISDPRFDYAVSLAFDAFRLDRKVIPYHISDLCKMPLDIRKSSPGYPWVDYGYKTRGEVMDDPAAVNSIRWFWHQIKQGKKVCGPDTKVLYRAHLMTDGEPKIRAVYGYPTTITIGEAIFAKPLIEGYKNAGTPMAYGYDMLTGGARRVKREIGKYSNYLCLDYKSFDKTVTNQLIDIAFLILLQNIDLSRYQDHGIPDAARLAMMFGWIREYFKSTPLRLFNGERWVKTAGIPSGSYFTQLVGSIVNYIITTFAFITAHGRPPRYLKVFGDDSILADDSQIDKFLLFKVIDLCGMIPNLEKTVCTNILENVEFLGFTVGTGFPLRSNDKWMGSLLWPERPDTSWDDYASRALGLFYSNAFCDINFHYTCKEIIMMRKFRINMPRNLQRFLAYIGVDLHKMSKSLPSDFDVIRALV